MEVEVLKFDHFGRGIAKFNNKIVFVHKALPNEIVDIKIIKEKSKFAEAEIIDIIKASPFRIASKCPYYKECGGCNFLHTDYNLEKEFKKNKCLELLGQCNHFYETTNLGYRNKCTLHVKNNKVGYYKENTHDLISVHSCLLLDQKINNVIADLQKIDLSE